jgi:hypothetical protein
MSWSCRNTEDKVCLTVDHRIVQLSQLNAEAFMEWIAQANINHFKSLLQTENDPNKLAMIRRLLAEEEAKLARFRKQGERMSMSLATPVNALD